MDLTGVPYGVLICAMILDRLREQNAGPEVLDSFANQLEVEVRRGWAGADPEILHRFIKDIHAEIAQSGNDLLLRLLLVFDEYR